MRDIGKNIKELRVSKKLTQDQLAEKLYVSRQTLSNYETGRSRPDINMLLEIANHLDTSLDVIIYGVDYRNVLRKHRTRITTFFIISIVLFIIYSVVKSNIQPYYSSQLYFVNIAIIRPLACMVFGWSLFYSLKIMCKNNYKISLHRKALYIIIVLVLSLYLIVIFPYVTALNFTIPIIWQRVFFRTIGLSGSISIINSSSCSFFIGIILNLLENKN